MRTRFLFPSLLLTLAFGCDAPVTPATDAFVTDGGTDAGMTDDVGIDGGAPSCGTAEPDLSGTGSSEGLTIGRDGTIYFSVSGGVARITPDGTLESSWLRITGASTVWGMVLDASNTHLYVGSPSLGEVVTVSQLDGTPTYETLVDVAAPNGLTFGPDGFLYVSNFSGNDVRRVDVATGADESILASPIQSANGLAFTDEGTLLVDSYSGARVFELTLDATFHETDRTTAAMGVGAPDGIAVDENGVLYVGDNMGRVLQIAADGTIETVLASGLPSAANIEFGAGPLNCHHLYVASGNGISRIELTVGQRAVPWH